MKPVEVRQHDDGTWYARPYLGVNKVTGKPIRPYRRFPDAMSEDEALEMARDWASGLTGAGAIGSTLRMSDVLERYIQENAPRWPDNTARAYRTCLNWLVPVIGDMDADELKPHLVEAAYNVLLVRGGLRGGALSPSSVRLVHDFLCGAFRWIVKAEVSPFNPMPSVAKPRPDHMEAVALTGADFPRLLSALHDAMSDDSVETPCAMRRTMAMAAYLSLMTGERCGEVCANLVSDADLGRRIMHVGATVVEPVGRPPVRQARTKGRKSRNVSLGPDTCAEIKRFLEWQGTILPEDVATEPSRPICCGMDGGLLRPTAVSRAFAEMRDGLGLPKGITFHTLRHTHATMLIANGADMRTVQERLGHANVTTTLSLYAHVVPGRDQAAAEKFDDMARMASPAHAGFGR